MEMAYTRRLFRSADDKVISGVAGGMAEYFQIDPVFVRLGWFASVFVTGGISILAYVVMIFIVPKGRYEPAETSGQSEPEISQAGSDTVKPESGMNGRKERRRYILGICLVLAGIGLLLYNLDIFDFLDWGILTAISVIGVGAAIIYASARRRR